MSASLLTHYANGTGGFCFWGDNWLWLSNKTRADMVKAINIYMSWIEKQ